MRARAATNITPDGVHIADPVEIDRNKRDRELDIIELKTGQAKGVLLEMMRF